MGMKLWILMPVKNLLQNDNPWRPWYDKIFAFVIRAETEKDARKFAHKNAQDEKDKNKHCWLDSKYSSCTKLTYKGVPGVIISDVAST